MVLKISTQGNLKWNKDAKICCSDKDWFSPASFGHMISCFILQQFITNIYLRSYKKTLDTKGIIITLFITNFLHAFEDYLENITINDISYSLEGALSRLGKCQNPRFLDHMDHDPLQNFLGDVISGIIGSLIALYVIKQYKFRISNIYILIIVLIIIILHLIICRQLE